MFQKIINILPTEIKVVHVLSCDNKSAFTFKSHYAFSLQSRPGFAFPASVKWQASASHETMKISAFQLTSFPLDFSLLLQLIHKKMGFSSTNFRESFCQGKT